MVEKVVKRDGRVVSYSYDKIFSAVMMAINEAKELGVLVENQIQLATDVADNVDHTVETIFDSNDLTPTVENIQDLVVQELEDLHPEVAHLYKQYRERRTIERTKNMSFIKSVQSIAKETTRDNANVGNNFSAKLLQIASETNKLANILNMPTDIAEAHTHGYIHIHDLDSYNLTINCLHVDTEQALKNGFNTGYGRINPPKRIDSAAALSCIILQSSQNDMFGGQSHYDFDNAMADYAEITEKEISKELWGYWEVSDLTEESVEILIAKKLKKAIHQAMQTVVYNLNSMASRAGSQVPFSTVNIGIPKNKYAAMVCEAFLIEYNKGLGNGEQPIFPNVIFRLKKGVNVNPDDPYYYLKQLAIKVAANRMNPTFLNCDASYNVTLYDQGILPATMGCRTRIASNVNGREGGKGRGNIAPVSINLPRLALLTRGSSVPYRMFMTKLDEILLLCERQLIHRYDVLKELKAKDLPFVAGEKLLLGSENLKPDDSIEEILKQGTYAIGFIGLAEAMTALFGEHHGEDKVVNSIAYNVVSHIREFCDAMTKEHQLNFTCYATPAEGLAGRFVEIDKKEFGIIEGVTDKDYYSNSFHIPVSYNIGAIEKIKIEAPYHALCNAGHITYVEFDKAPVDNVETLEKIIDYAVNETDIGYFGFNFGEVYCKDCGKNHIQGNLCPDCGSSNLQEVDRVTGYLSLKERFSPGKKAECEDRVNHTI